MLTTQIGVVIDGRETVLLEGEVVEVERMHELAAIRGACPAAREPVSDLDGDVVRCSICDRLWRVPRGMDGRTTRCGNCSPATDYKLRVLAS